MKYPYKIDSSKRIAENKKSAFDSLQKGLNTDAIAWHKEFEEKEILQLRLERLDQAFPQWAKESNDLLYIFAIIGIFKLPVIYLLDYLLCQQSIEVLVKAYPASIVHIICFLIPVLILFMDIFVGMGLYLSERLKREGNPNNKYSFWAISGILFSLTIPMLVISTFYAFGKMGNQDFALTIPFIMLSIGGHLLMIYEYSHFESMYFYQFLLGRIRLIRSIKRKRKV